MTKTTKLIKRLTDIEMKTENIKILTISEY